MAAVALGTKAETLDRLARIVQRSHVLPLISFTLREWYANPESVLTRIRQAWGGGPVVVRSSAIIEDSANASFAGAFLSRLDVPVGDPLVLRMAIEEVIASLPGDDEDQVLVQPMARNIRAAGVVLTRAIADGAPYYVIDYDDESGQTDSITGGTHVAKTVWVYRDARREHIRSDQIWNLLEAVREVEKATDDTALDVEFAILDDGRILILQARRIATRGSWTAPDDYALRDALQGVIGGYRSACVAGPGISGSRTIFGLMPDWNPAEMIGAEPRPLAYSLYRRLITRSSWAKARAVMGYRALPGQELMIRLGTRPYIDVRASANSFLPADLPEPVASAAIDAYIGRLNEHPEYHDKIEFEIVPTAYDFTVKSDMRARYPDVFSPRDLATYAVSLRDLTARALAPGRSNTLERMLKLVRRREREQSGFTLDEVLDRTEVLEFVRGALGHARRGAYRFSVLARHAFIAETLLRSAVRRGALTKERLATFRNSIRTITSELTECMAAAALGHVPAETFYRRFGHLRPGTYDIRSARYDQRQGLIGDDIDARSVTVKIHEPFQPTEAESRALDALLVEAGLPCDAARLLEYGASAIAAREYGKFVFTRDLSDALEAIRRWGERVGLDPETLSYLAIEEVLGGYAVEDLKNRANRARHAQARLTYVRLGHLIREECDIVASPVHRSLPNFVGRGRITAPVVELRPGDDATRDLRGRIVCIEGADPGYDWIFTRGIAGLVTRFGGANSHMAIRAAELALPAVIGCGERLYQQIAGATFAEIDLDQHRLMPSYAH